MSNLVNRIDQQLADLGLYGIKENYARRHKQAIDDGLSFDDFLGLLLHEEADYRRANRIKRLLQKAGFKQGAALESLDLQTSRGLDKKQINDLVSSRHIKDGIGLIIMGPTGVGKTFLASALGNAACRNGLATYFYRMNNLLEQIALVRAKGTYLNFLKKLAAADLLIIDDFGIKPLAPNQFQDFYDVIDERGEAKSTIITTQLPVENWDEVIADSVTCEAITDRLVSRAVKIHMKGDSYRKKSRGKKAEDVDKV